MVGRVSAASFEVYPAIDVRDGRVVRLAQGDYARETRYDDMPPLERSHAYARAGARWLHLVDLDAARTGGYTLGPLLRRIKRETPLRVQTGGGVRSERDIDNLFDAGADRVVVGSLAMTEPARVAGWLVRYGADRITIAIDARMREDGSWFPATHGWTREVRRPLEDVLVEYLAAGLRHLLCTDIDRDGMLAGPNLALYAQMVEWAPRIAVQASGGARHVDDVRAARDVGCGGVVLGKALLDDRIDLAEALRC